MLRRSKLRNRLSGSILGSRGGFPFYMSGSNLLFFDHFDGAAGVNLNLHTPNKGGTWTQPFSGADQLQLNGSGQATPPYPASTFPRHIASGSSTANGTFWLNYFQSCPTANPGTYGVIFNYQDINNYWLIGGLFNFRVLSKVIAGVQTDLVSSAWGTGGSGDNANHTIVVSVNGDNVKMWRDSVLEINYTVGARQLKTQTGFGVATQNNGFGGQGNASFLHYFGASVNIT